jgi:vesicle coat complex subunit
MLIMTSIIRVGQSKFVTVQIDEDSNERILNCIQTLSDLEDKSAVYDIFLRDTKTAYTKMLGAQEVGFVLFSCLCLTYISCGRKEPLRRRKQRLPKSLWCKSMIC